MGMIKNLMWLLCWAGQEAKKIGEEKEVEYVEQLPRARCLLSNKISISIKPKVTL